MDLYKCHSCLSVIKIIERVPSPRRAAQGIYNISRETGRLRYVNWHGDSMGTWIRNYYRFRGGKLDGSMNIWSIRAIRSVKSTPGEKINIEKGKRKKKRREGGDKYRCDAVTTGNKCCGRKIISTLKNRTEPNRRFDYRRIGFPFSPPFLHI